MSVVGPPGFNCWISYIPVFSCIYTVESLSLFYLLLYLDLYIRGVIRKFAEKCYYNALLLSIAMKIHRYKLPFITS